MLHRTLAVLVLASLGLNASQWFVSTTGSDTDAGTLAAPFRTIQKGVSTLGPGDTCYVRGGVYRESVVLSSSGEKGRPIRIRTFPGELVVLDGTEPVQGGWISQERGVWTTETTLKLEQLFSGETMLTEARWPNCPPGKNLTREGWATAGPGSEYGILRDPELAETGVDWNGAMAILNVAHQFWSWSRTVEGYEPGSDALPYTITMNPFHTENRNWWDDDFYYLVGKREALDAQGEWFLGEEGSLSIVSGAKPTDVRAKQRDYAFTGKNLKFVEISGFRFFGCSFRLTDCENCVVEHCNLLYPSYARGVPGAEEKGRRKSCPGTLVTGKGNAILSCSFEHCPSYGVILRGERNRIENCIVHDVNWTGTLHYTALRLQGTKGVAEARNVARRNTLYNVGNTILNCSGPFSVVERNHVHHGGLISSDVSLIYTSMPAADGIEFRYNWVHDSLSPHHSLGIRGDDKTRGLRVHHNVVWNVASWGIITKGGRNRVYNNTMFANGAADVMFLSGREPDKWWQKHVKAYEKQNEDSFLVNNFGKVLASRPRGAQPPLPGDCSNNYTANAPKLVDPGAFDFRPREDSPLVDAGRVLKGITAPYAGKAPDIGAYEFGGDHWLPGHHNGIWLARTGGLLHIRLDLPILEPVEIRVLHDGKAVESLPFTPADWWQSQPVAELFRGQVVFAAKGWGRAVVPDVSHISGLADAHAEFSKPDLASARIVDSSPKYAYENSPIREPVARARIRAFFHEPAPVIDGLVEDGEWPGWSRSRAIPLESLLKNSEDFALGGEGYALFDGKALSLAVRITSKGDPLLHEGGRWGPGGTGGVEFDFATYSRRRTGAVFVLHGYPSGRLESVTDGGADAESSARFGVAVTYAARILADGVWSCELRVPLAALGVDVSDLQHVRFNLGLRSNGAEGGPWFAAVKTGGANYYLRDGAALLFDRRVRADAVNLLKTGGFENEENGPWVLTSNRREPLPPETVQRLARGRGGAHCIQLLSQDKEMMVERVLKWTHPLKQLSAPGLYCLSYDVCVPSRRLAPCGGMGSFNSYVHIRPNGKGGRNKGQRESMLTSTGGRWIRRDFMIDIPAGAVPSMVSLQLHHATGAVLIDNVSLVSCGLQ
ncbi:MAG: right-handed parallel beta-helix repeat-containing protein [Lentisphaeria bacterium]|nr:right-handed parallel beta-helix repeat-containing protein [Lentisphaeria bacterium]